MDKKKCRAVTISYISARLMSTRDINSSDITNAKLQIPVVPILKVLFNASTQSSESLDQSTSQETVRYPAVSSYKQVTVP
jgi:hypothetical protein